MRKGKVQVRNSSVISDVDYFHPYTLRVVEKVLIRGLVNPESGRSDWRFNHTLSRAWSEARTLAFCKCCVRYSSTLEGTVLFPFHDRNVMQSDQWSHPLLLSEISLSSSTKVSAHSLCVRCCTRGCACACVCVVTHVCVRESARVRERASEGKSERSSDRQAELYETWNEVLQDVH